LYDGTQRLRRADGPDSTEIYYYSGPTRVLAVEHARTPGGPDDTLGDIVRVRRWLGGAELHYSLTERTRTWQHVTLGEQPVARIENGTEIELTFQTPQGHEAMALSADGTLRAGKRYGPFGEVLEARLAPGVTPRDHTRELNGKDYDDVSGWHYYGHRYFDPVALMWNRADPM